jgi:phosphohistidine phosphatase
MLYLFLYYEIILTFDVQSRKTVGKKMKLYLIRHAKTNQKSPTGLDIDRSLLPRGIAQSKDLNAFLQSLDLTIGTVLCSTARRTKQTLQNIKIEDSAAITYLDSLYLANNTLLLGEINRIENTKDLMLIGHNEGISELAGYLTGENIYFKTGMLYILNFQGESWTELSAETATIEGFYRSESR